MNNYIYSFLCNIIFHLCLNTLRLRQNGRHFPDDIFKRIFFNEIAWISIKISLKFVPKGPINNIPALVQIMAWRRSGDKPLSEPMMDSLPTHICVIRPPVICTWISNCIYKFLWNVITHPCPNIISGAAKLLHREYVSAT